MSVDDFMAALCSLLGKDEVTVRDSLAAHLPQPRALEAKLESEQDYYNVFNKATNTNIKATKQKAGADRKLKECQRLLDEAQATFDQQAAKVTATEIEMVRTRKEYFQFYPTEAASKADLVHELDTEDGDEPERKKTKPTAAGDAEEWAAKEEADGDVAMGAAAAAAYAAGTAAPSAAPGTPGGTAATVAIAETEGFSGISG